MKHLFPMILLAALLGGSAGANPCAEYPCVWYCGFDSLEITDELDGAVVCGEFVDGLIGPGCRIVEGVGCLTMPARPDPLAFSWDCGLIDLRFQLESDGGLLPDGDGLVLFRLAGEGAEWSLRLANDPANDAGGLIARVGQGCEVASHAGSAVTLDDVIPSEDQSGWHHVLLAWCRDGLQDVDGHRVAVVLDEVVLSSHWIDECGSLPAMDELPIQPLANVPAGWTCTVESLRIFPFADSPGLPLAFVSEGLLDPSRDALFADCSGAGDLAHAFRLLPNHPNPFNPETVLEFEVPETAMTSVRIHDLQGRLVRTLHDGLLEGGSHRMRFDGSGLPSGVYICRIDAGNLRLARAITLLK